jgi:hypothetical protein
MGIRKDDIPVSAVGNREIKGVASDSTVFIQECSLIIQPLAVVVTVTDSKLDYTVS